MPEEGSSRRLEDFSRAGVKKISTVAASGPISRVTPVGHSHWFSFFIGLFGFIFIPLMGRVSISEVLALVALLFIVTSAIRIGADFWRLILAMTVLVVGILLSTVAHADQGAAAISAVANYGLVFVMMTVLVFHLSLSGGASWPYLVVGASVGQLIGNLINPTRTAEIDPWKFGIGWSVTLAFMLLIRKLDGSQSLRILVLPAIGSLAALHFAMNSRSLSVVVLICGVLVFRSRRNLGSGKEGVRRSGWLLAFIALGIYLASLLYEFLAAAGTFGLNAASKYQDQQGDFGVLFGARKELVVLALAWARSPVLGWGPSARVSTEVLNSAQEWFISGHYYLNFSDARRLFGVEELPLHSVLLGGLVQCGVFFIPLGLIILWIVQRSLRVVVSTGDYVGLFIVLSGVVHLFTSPLGDTTRLPIAMALALGAKLFIAPSSTRRESSS